MQTQKYRILEWTSVFTHGAPVLEYEVQVLQTADARHHWKTLGTSLSLDNARKALLFHATKGGLGLS